MSGEEDARRIASGPLPSELVGGAGGDSAHDGAWPASSASPPQEGGAASEEQAMKTDTRILLTEIPARRAASALPPTA